MSNYYVLHMNEDGEVSCNSYNSKEQLQDDLNRECWGHVEFGEYIPEFELEAGKIYIIKGDLVQPKPVNRVVSYEF